MLSYLPHNLYNIGYVAHLSESQSPPHPMRWGDVSLSQGGFKS